MPRVIIPGLAEALAQTKSWRETAFFADALPVCGQPLRLLTAMDVVVYDSAGNRFFTGGEPDWTDLVHFLWWQSTANRHQHRSRGWCGWRQRLFALRLMRLNVPQAIAAVQEFIDWQILDAPASSGSGRADDATCLVAAVVDVIASQYHWPERDVLKLPLARLFQYVQAIQQRHDPTRPAFNRLADKAKGDWLRAHNPAHN